MLSSASAGGAGIAALRVAQALRTHAGHELDFFDMGSVGAVSQEVSPQRSVTNGRLSNTHFTEDHGTAVREWLVRDLAGYDLVNAHWTSYLLSVADLEAIADTGVPLLLTLHDFNHVTGGCHYPGGCTGLQAACDACPQVDAERFARADVQRNKLRKNALFARPNVHLSAPSRYVLETAGAAVGLPPSRLHLLRNPYDPLPGVPWRGPAENRPFTILLVADSLAERRKGAALAAEAILQLNARLRGERTLRIHVAGLADEGLLRTLRSTGAELLVHGRLKVHEHLAYVYADSHVQLSTSHEDNWPNVLVEAGAYGCLAIAGPGHGCEEFVREFDAGALTADYAPESFAQALLVLARLGQDEIEARQRTLSQAVRAAHAPALVAHDFDVALQAMAARPKAPLLAHGAAATADSPAVSSNYLGAATRVALARQAGAPGPGARLVVHPARRATSSSTVMLHACVGGQVEPALSATLDQGEASFPLQIGGRPLRHVFATEYSDYGVSSLAFEVTTDDARAACPRLPIRPPRTPP